jgi:hypothetical protein
MTTALATNSTDLATLTDQLVTEHGVPKDIVVAITKIDAIAARCSPAKLAKLPAVFQTVVLAKAMRDLRIAMTKEIVDTVFMPLQGSRLGFRTDKDKDGGYGWEVVRDVLIEAMTRGLRPINNEFNIIAEGFYAAQTGLERLVREYPGISGLEFAIGVPVPDDKKGCQLVSYHASWWLYGERGELVCDVVPATKPDGTPILRSDNTNVLVDNRIPVRMNAGQGPDAVQGKAKRKGFARILEKLTGMKVNDGDAADVIETTGESVEEGQRRATRAAADKLADDQKKKTEQRRTAMPPPPRPRIPSPPSEPERKQLPDYAERISRRAAVPRRVRRREHQADPPRALSAAGAREPHRRAERAGQVEPDRRGRDAPRGQGRVRRGASPPWRAPRAHRGQLRRIHRRADVHGKGRDRVDDQGRGRQRDRASSEFPR